MTPSWPSEEQCTAVAYGAELSARSGGEGTAGTRSAQITTNSRACIGAFQFPGAHAHSRGIKGHPEQQVDRTRGAPLCSAMANLAGKIVISGAQKEQGTCIAVVRSHHFPLHLNCGSHVCAINMPPPTCGLQLILLLMPSALAAAKLFLSCCCHAVQDEWATRVAATLPGELTAPRNTLRQGPAPLHISSAAVCVVALAAWLVLCGMEACFQYQSLH